MLLQQGQQNDSGDTAKGTPNSCWCWLQLSFLSFFLGCNFFFLYSYVHRESRVFLPLLSFPILPLHVQPSTSPALSSVPKPLVPELGGEGVEAGRSNCQLNVSHDEVILRYRKHF
jgi:hypothetical protein